jgi:hypothetical protein
MRRIPTRRLSRTCRQRPQPFITTVADVFASYPFWTLGRLHQTDLLVSFDRFSSLSAMSVRSNGQEERRVELKLSSFFPTALR